MTLDEIFKDNPELLKEQSVKVLIDYSQEMHAKSYNLVKKYEGFHDFVLDKLMYSEIILIDGLPSKKVLEEILEEINKF